MMRLLHLSSIYADIHFMNALLNFSLVLMNFWDVRELFYKKKEDINLQSAPSGCLGADSYLQDISFSNTQPIKGKAEGKK